MSSLPRARRGTRFRVIGPININGMNVWRVYDLASRRRVGPDCFTRGEAHERVNDAISGKKVIWFGHTKMERKAIS